jgi:hypothetical protein
MERRIRTSWLVRRRFRQAANAASIIGVVLAMIPIIVAVNRTTVAWRDPGFLTGAMGIVVIGAVAPRLAIHAVWRLIRWRNHEEWG